MKKRFREMFALLDFPGDSDDSVYRDWKDYKTGFGDMTSANGEFWLGNDNLYYLTCQGGSSLYV